MAQSEVRIAWEPLKEFIREVFTRAGVPPEDAETEASALIWANLRGVDSHGVLRTPWYVQNIDTGVMNPRPDIQVVKETPATLLVDADRALGPVATIFTLKLVMEKARKMGIGWAIIRNLTHQGALGHYSQMVAKEDMAGIVFVCNPPNMAPYGARAAGVHNSPIAISVPAKRHHPLNLDMATSVVAGGKLWLAVDKGIPIPEGWALDKEGNPTTDPKKYTTLLPVGGPKGSGLAIMFECLTGVMVGNPLLGPTPLDKAEEIKSSNKKPEVKWERPGHVPRHIQNSVVAAIDISNFTDVEEYKEHIDNLIDGIKALPKAEGFNEIFVPGEPEERTYGERIKNGIPLPEGTLRNLRGIAERFNIPLPPGI
ncbi:MAG: Ldh family oxidoreductase [Dehalococcoidales bacterium]